MIKRKSKIRFVQSLLLVLSIILISLTYFFNQTPKEKIISSKEKDKLKIENKSSDQDVFYNIKYSGLDLSGNRYILTSKVASVNKNLQEIVNMKFVNAVFYFKDNTTLVVDSDKGIYNNKSLDMIFQENVLAKYEGSTLSGEKIVYSNSDRMLEISNNVKVNDKRGTVLADKLLFDLDEKKLDISSNKNSVKTNINLKWKKVLRY